MKRKLLFGVVWAVFGIAALTALRLGYTLSKLNLLQLSKQIHFHIEPIGPIEFGPKVSADIHMFWASSVVVILSAVLFLFTYVRRHRRAA